MIKQCLICREDFKTHLYDIQNGNGRFCSRKCMGIWRSQNIRAEKIWNWKGGEIIKTCQLCQKEFYVCSRHIKRGRGKFCSYKCMGIWQSRNLIGKNSRNWSGGKREHVCKICNKMFYRFPSEPHNFCSKKCRIQFYRGSNTHFWKGGITSVKLLIRSQKEYNVWRTKIFTRDNFTCQKCGDNSGGNLEAHHIKKFSILLQESKEYMPLLNWKDACMFYSPLWDIKNGITLCITCHNKTRK